MTHVGIFGLKINHLATLVAGQSKDFLNGVSRRDSPPKNFVSREKENPRLENQDSTACRQCGQIWRNFDFFGEKIVPNFSK
jgi:hypothetical protein